MRHEEGEYWLVAEYQLGIELSHTFRSVSS